MISINFNKFQSYIQFVMQSSSESHDRRVHLQEICNMNCKMAGLMGAAAGGAAGHVAEKKMKEKSEDTGLLGMGQAVGYNMLYQWTQNFGVTVCVFIKQFSSYFYIV